jgi:signal transduction histidine kinase/ligand-binding sensor domain-containing protein
LKTVLIISGLIFFSAGRLFAQPASRNIVLYSVSEANGLSDDHVQCVLKDKSNLVWIGTADGLNVIDGSSITIFKHRNHDSTSLVNNNVFSLAEDGNGNIWVGCSEGLSCYLKQKKTFLSFVPAISTNAAPVFINSIVIDKKQRIWCSSDGGLMLFDPLKKNFQPFFNTVPDKKNNDVFRNKLTHMIADNVENKLWLSTADGLWSFNLNTFRYQKEISASNDSSYQALFTYVFESSDNKIWAATWGNGLEQLDKNTGQVTHYLSAAESPRIVKCINEVQQADGNYILWLDGDLLAFDPSTNFFFHYAKPPQFPEIAETWPCYQSSDGWIWLASSSGLYIYTPQRQFFRHHYFSSSISSQGVFFSELNNLLAVGGEGKGFLKFYDKDWNIKRDFSWLLRLSDGGNANQSHAAALWLALQNNIFWISSSEGIVKTNTETGQSVWFRHKNGDSSTLPRNFISHLFFDSKKTFWIFPWREGIWTMDTLTGKCKKMWDGFIKINGKTKKLLIASAAEDKNGNIWMADLDEGIVLYERKTGKFSKPFVKEIGEMTNTGSIFYRDGFLYSATGSSLLKWNEDSMHLQFIDLPPEMSKAIYDICPDLEGNWWIATKNGLVVFNETKKTFNRFTSADGLLNNDMNGTLFCRKDGTMLFGQANYITSFSPDEILSVISTVPDVRLQELLVNNNSVKWNDPEALHLNYHSKNILFKWALPDFSNPFHNQYYCMLQGIDSDWRYIGNKGEVQYANLSPGKYTVQLKAASANGVVSPNIIMLSFIIKPPFWKTTWFIFLLSIATITIFGLTVRYISQRNLKEKLLKLEKEQAIEKERNRISRDMHDDLGSGLTKIAILSEVVKKQLNEPEKAKQQLENISESSRELVDNLQNIIWVLNPKNDTLESLAAYIREHTLKFFEPLGVETIFNYPEKFTLIKLSEEARRNIFLTIKETLNNIGKHAWCNTVELSIKKIEQGIQLTIKDDGRGFDANNIRPFANGLINMKNRIEQIGGKYEILSEPGKGTTTVITVAS